MDINIPSFIKKKIKDKNKKPNHQPPSNMSVFCKTSKTLKNTQFLSKINYVVSKSYIFRRMILFHFKNHHFTLGHRVFAFVRNPCIKVSNFFPNCWEYCGIKFFVHISITMPWLKFEDISNLGINFGWKIYFYVKLNKYRSIHFLLLMTFENDFFGYKN